MGSSVLGVTLTRGQIGRLQGSRALRFRERLWGLWTEFSVVSKGKISVQVALGVTATPRGRPLGLKRKSVDIIYVDF